MLASVRIGIEHLVEREGQDFQRVQVHDERAQRGLQVGHDQSGRDTFAFDLGADKQQRLRAEVDEVVIVGGHVKTEVAQNGDVITGHNRRRVRQQAMLDAARQRELALQTLFFHAVTVQLRVFQGHGHVAGKFGEEADIVIGERATLRVEELQHAHDLTRVMADGQAEQGLSAVVQPLVKAGIE